MTVSVSDMRPGAILQAYEGSKYAYKLIESQYHSVGASGEYFWVYRTGKIVDNKFVIDESADSYTIGGAASLRQSVKHVWTPEVQFSEGDVLVAKDGTVVFVGAMNAAYSENYRMFHYATPNRGHDRRETIECKHGKLTKLKSSTGKTFTGVKVV